MSLKLAAFGSDPNGGVEVVGVRQAFSLRSSLNS